ncbi:hypothetical protein [Clostridium tarantellae]|uniref:Uncharacterized protein n=1 Tax=Clostridium tarantellae TaxID=39493 RepID=A0A6I1MGW8_9CLOT|nr:hypothetical protein [Clostridium tarantellae]MPQ42615.1 hypothetical protein [Clostridium tarantellae]
MVRKKWLEPTLTNLNVKYTKNAGLGFYGSDDSSSGSSNSDSKCSSNNPNHKTYLKQHGLV